MQTPVITIRQSEQPADCGHHYEVWSGTNDAGEPFTANRLYTDPNSETLRGTMCPDCFYDAMSEIMPFVTMSDVAAAFGGGRR